MSILSLYSRYGEAVWFYLNTNFCALNSFKFFFQENSGFKIIGIQ